MIKCNQYHSYRPDPHRYANSKEWADSHQPDIRVATLNVMRKYLPKSGFQCKHLKQDGPTPGCTGKCYIVTYDGRHEMDAQISEGGDPKGAKGRSSGDVPPDWKWTRVEFSGNPINNEEVLGKGVRDMYYLRRTSEDEEDARQLARLEPFGSSEESKEL
jgi:hypothetical protein